MKTKPKDTLYCGVSRDKIEKASPELNISALELFLEYINERYDIHVKKDVGHKKPPYTDNKILRKYRFTNIRREHDRETLWLIDNITDNAFLTYRQKILNVVLFRLYNKHETLEIIGAPFKFEGVWNPGPSIKLLKAFAKENPKFAFFTNAFLTSGLKKTLNLLYPKEKFVPALPLKFMENLNNSNFFEDLNSCKNQQEVFKLLSSMTGIGDFLAYQIFVDFTYIPEFPFSENEFTVAGPGCQQGIDFLFLDTDGLNYEECIFWIRDNWDEIQTFVPHKFRFDPQTKMIDLKQCDRVMNVMSLENCFCEFSKYYRAVNDIGRPRNTYKPRKD